MRTIATSAELDAFIAACDRAPSDDALRALMGTVRMEPPADLPADPASPEYAARIMALYWSVAGREYAVANEVTPVDVDAAVRLPFPYSTRSTRTAGAVLAATGFVLGRLELPAGARVLEFGPGWGGITLAMARLGLEVTAVDVDPAFCALLRRRAAHDGLPLTVVQDDFFFAERVTAPFDAVLFNASFHHCADHRRLLRALHGAVRSDGRVFFGAEPIGGEFPLPWGLRLDGQSLWSIRKHGWLELGFSEAYFASALAAAGWRSVCRRSADDRALTLWEAMRTDAPLHYPADDPRLNTPIGHRDGGRIHVDAAGPGAAVAGPKAVLAAGRWRARFHLDPAVPRRGRVLVDACHQDAWVRVAERRCDLAREPTVVDLDFALDAGVEDLEVRIFPGRQGTAFSLAALEIVPLAADDPGDRIALWSLTRPRGDP